MLSRSAYRSCSKPPLLLLPSSTSSASSTPLLLLSSTTNSNICSSINNNQQKKKRKNSLSNNDFSSFAKFSNNFCDWTRRRNNTSSSSFNLSSFSLSSPSSSSSSSASSCSSSSSSSPSTVAAAALESVAPVSSSVCFESRRMLRVPPPRKFIQMTKLPDLPSELLKRKNWRDPVEGLPRYPNFTSVMGALRALDYLGTCAFSVSGCLLAATYGLNATGCILVGTVTALGGGAIRDMIFGTLPVSFIDEYEYVLMSVFFAALTFTLCVYYTPTPSHMQSFERIMFWLDSVGLGAFTIIAAMFATSRNLPLTLVLISVVITCTGGGIMRDLAVRRRIRAFNNYLEAYLETVVAGALCYVAMRKIGIPLHIRATVGALTVMTLRYLATEYNFSLPQATALRSQYQPPVQHN